MNSFLSIALSILGTIHSIAFTPTTTPLLPVVSSDIQYTTQTTSNTCLANQALPDPSCTPGAVLTTDASVVCVSGYSSKVRNVSVATKEKAFAEYGIPYSEHANYEVDHLISLELGGSNDISNLWPEAHNIADGSFVKDGLENHLHAEVCKGNLTLSEAQHEISTNWMAAYSAWKGTPVPTQSQTPIQSVQPAMIPAVAPQKPVSTVDTSINASNPPVKESTSGICHPLGDSYYNRTTHFTAFNSMADCLSAGGRASAK